jgi:hypothetical protein
LCCSARRSPDYWLATARLIGLTGFTVILLAACQVALFISSTKPSGATGHVKMREMKEEFATLEHEITEQEE